MSRRRHLSDEERALWAGFVRSIKPLRPLREPSPDQPAERASPDSTPRPPRLAAQHESQPSANKPLPLAPLGRRLRLRVARGREMIDDRIDLHGLTQSQAHAALLRFLRTAQADGAKMVLVVTGKGRGSDESNAPTERGVLRRQVPMWLSLPEFRPFVVGFDDAHVGHGGQGALYVRVRRRR